VLVTVESGVAGFEVLFAVVLLDLSYDYDEALSTFSGFLGVRLLDMILSDYSTIYVWFGCVGCIGIGFSAHACSENS
jgi:hypothetical protein